MESAFRKKIEVNEQEDFRDLNFYRFVICSLPNAVVTVNADMKITGFNAWAEKVTGYSSVEALRTQGYGCTLYVQF